MAGNRTILSFSGALKYPNLVQISAPADGSCYFHAIANSYFLPYREEMLNGIPISRGNLIRELRNDLALRLEDRTVPGGPTVYETLSRGQLPDLAKTDPRYTLENMKKELASSMAVDNLYDELISNELSIDLYVIDKQKQDVRVNLLDDDDLLHIGRRSVVLILDGAHYELVGVDTNNALMTIFPPDHPFISVIRERINNIREKKSY